ncbi:MAG: DUF3090 domain-containing protein [Chloroflexi bacterium]|nr:DUF3090 domain-containing protein [Chloroflexota bacterium]
MAGTEYELNPVTHITTGAIGPAGKRVFYLQARQTSELVTLIVEKAQVQALAVGLEQYLQELGQRFPDLPPASPEFHESAMALAQPLDPAFRVGQLGLGYDESSDRLVLVAREVQPEGADPEEAAVARFWCTRSQLLAMCRWGVEIATRGRPICGNCGEPIDPEGHFCPKRNGHKH